MGEIARKYLKAVPLDKLDLWDKNPRTIEPAAFARLKSKISALGVFKPLLAVKAGADKYRVIGGNQRLKAYRELGLKACDVILFPTLTDKKIITKIAIADNQNDGITDTQKLKELLYDCGFEPAELEDYAVSCGGDIAVYDILGEDDFEEADEVPAIDSDAPAVTKEGDVWLLGQHRLMCADSTSADSVKKLMNGKKAKLLITDPPYNVNYKGSNGKKIQNDNMEAGKFLSFLRQAFENANEVMAQGAAFYIFHADTVLEFKKACADTGWQIRQTLVWVKDHFTLGRQDYQWQHESCIYGWKDGAAHYFAPDRGLSTLLELKAKDIDELKKEELQSVLKEIMGESVPKTVLRCPKPLASEEHPTMKPVNLIAPLIRNSTKIGWPVLDLFGGSGTTLIACEHLQRPCYMMEVDPSYCDVIVKRYAAIKGEEDIFLIDGKGRKKAYAAVFAGG